jgi:hypothetical protein
MPHNVALFGRDVFVEVLGVQAVEIVRLHRNEGSQFCEYFSEKDGRNCGCGLCANLEGETGIEDLVCVFGGEMRWMRERQIISES